MVGAKQFAIRRKVAMAKRVNPVLAAIKLPAFMKLHEADLHKSDSFEEKPSAASFSFAKLIQEKQPIPRRATSKVAHPQEENKNEVISDELANLISYKVLKNIKNYLNPQREMGMGSKHIKLEISL
jgi:hypothetical protein